VPVRELLGRRSGEGREPARDRTDVPREGVCVTASFRRPMSRQSPSRFFWVSRCSFFWVSPPKKKQNKTQQMSRQSHNFRDRKRAKVENRLKPNLLT
jgi:hypothetical protein